MNFLKFQAARLQGEAEAQDGGEGDPRIPEWLEEADRIRNRIVQANLRLALSLTGRFASAECPLPELFSEVMLPLIRSVELYNVSQGHRFSTYATHAIRHALGRAVHRRLRDGNRFSSLEAEIDAVPAVRDDVDAVKPEECVSTVHSALESLPKRERQIVAARFGLDEFDREHTFLEIGRLLGLSKERVRVLAHRALETVRDQLPVQRLEWDLRP